jgi:hypothetical protein
VRLDVLPVAELGTNRSVELGATKLVAELRRDRDRVRFDALLPHTLLLRVQCLEKRLGVVGDALELVSETNAGHDIPNGHDFEPV